MNKFPSEMTPDELHVYACGRMLLAIGRGDFHNELWSLMDIARRQGYATAEANLSKKKKTNDRR
jgi:hypothetical protein